MSVCLWQQLGEKVFPEKLAVSQLVNELPALMKRLKFIIFMTKPYHLVLRDKVKILSSNTHTHTHIPYNSL